MDKLVVLIVMVQLNQLQEVLVWQIVTEIMPVLVVLLLQHYLIVEQLYHFLEMVLTVIVPVHAPVLAIVN